MQYLHLLQDLEHILIETFAIKTAHGVHVLRQFLVKGLGDLFRLTDATAFDDDIIKFLELSQTHQLFEEISPKCTADATILEGDDLFVCFCETVGLLDEGSINIDAVTGC